MTDHERRRALLRTITGSFSLGVCTAIVGFHVSDWQFWLLMIPMVIVLGIP